MSIAAFDKIDVNRGLLLSLPFREGTGLITHDVAKPEHLLTQHDPGGGSFAWGNLPSGCPYLQFLPIGGGAADGVYLDAPAADTVDLNFTSGPYSIGGWINWGAGTNQSEILIGRYATEVDGWDCHLNATLGATLSVRHNHSSLVPDHTTCFSIGWTPGEWHFMGISRTGPDVAHYRNGIPLTMAPTPTAMGDPDTANRDVVMGARAITLAGNWYYDMMWDIRVWGRALSGDEWKFIFNRERHWFGV